jgi:hypothetical protein
MNLNLPKVSDHVSNILGAMMTKSSTLRTEGFANKLLASILSAVTTAEVTTKSHKATLMRGSLVTATAPQQTDLLANTNGNPPNGLVYNLDRCDKGNGPATFRYWLLEKPEEGGAGVLNDRNR